MSIDGGTTFNHVHSFMFGEFIVNCDHSEQRIACLTSTGRLYHSRPRTYQMIELEIADSLLLQNTSRLVFDSLGELNAIGINNENGAIVSTAIPLVFNEKVNMQWTLEYFTWIPIVCNIFTHKSVSGDILFIEWYRNMFKFNVNHSLTSIPDYMQYYIICQTLHYNIQFCM